MRFLFVPARLTGVWLPLLERSQPVASVRLLCLKCHSTSDKDLKPREGSDLAFKNAFLLLWSHTDDKSTQKKCGRELKLYFVQALQHARASPQQVTSVNQPLSAHLVTAAKDISPNIWDRSAVKIIGWSGQPYKAKVLAANSRRLATNKKAHTDELTLPSAVITNRQPPYVPEKPSRTSFINGKAHTGTGPTPRRFRVFLNLHGHPRS